VKILISLLYSSVSTHSDSGECPAASFKCQGGRCLPLSWRCNGQVECLGEGSDEQGCDAEAETPAPPKHGFTPAEGAKARASSEKNLDGDSERRYATDSESDLWALLKERDEVAREQARRQLVVTPVPIEWPCGGLLQTFYGTFSPPATRGPALFCVWTVDPEDSRPLRLDLQQLGLGRGDRLTVYNKEQGKGDVIRIVSYFKLLNRSKHFLPSH